MTGKHFTQGDAVLVQLSPSAPWTSARYRKAAGLTGHHVVDGPVHYVNMRTGDVTDDEDGPEVMRSAVWIVPSRRIKAA